MENRRNAEKAVGRRSALVALLVLFFVWPLRLLKMKSFWVLAIAAFYIFRVSLLSGPVTHVLTDYIYRYGGIKIAIAEFGGTVLGNIYLRGIHLEEETDSVKELEVEEISVSYNVLAPLFGGRILREISITAPKISLAAQAKEEKGREMRLGAVDFGILVGHAPDIHITRAGFTYEDAGRKFAVSNFNWHSTPHGGTVSFDRAGGENAVGPLSAEWRFAGRVLTLEKVSACLGDIAPDTLVVERPLAIDLSRAGVSAVAIDSPLPGGWLVGSLDLREDFELHIKKLEIDLAQAAQAVLGKSREIKPLPLELRLYADILCPDWDPAALRGQASLAISEIPGSPMPFHPESRPSIPGMLARAEIDLAAVRNFLRSLEMRDVPDVAGTVSIETVAAPSGTGIMCEGKIEGDRLRFEGRALPLCGRWDFLYDDGRATLDQLSLEWGPARFRCNADASFTAERRLRLDAELDLPSLAPFLPLEFADILEAGVAASLEIQGHIPDAVSGRLALKVKEAAFHKRKLGDFHSEGEWLIAGRNWQLLSFRLAQEGRAVLQLSGKGGLDPKSDWSAQGRLELKDIARAIAEWTQGGKSDIIAGDVGVDFSLAGKIPAPGTLPDLQGKIEATSPELIVAGALFQDLYSAADFALSGRRLAVKAATVRLGSVRAVAAQTEKPLWGRALSLDIEGSFGLPGETSDFTCALAIPDIGSINPWMEKSPSGSVEAGIHVQGDLSAWEKIPLSIEGSVRLKDVSYGKFRPGPLRLDLSARASLREVELSRLSLRGRKVDVLTQGTAAWDRESRVSIRLTVSPAQWLPKKIRPWAAGTLTGDIALASSPEKKSGRCKTIHTRCNLQWTNECPDIPYRKIELEARASLGLDRLRLRQMRLELDGEEVLRAKGKFDRRRATATGEVELEAVRVGEHALKWYPKARSLDLRGRLSARAKFEVAFSGPLKSEGAAVFNLREFNLGRLSCRELSAKGRWSTAEHLQLSDISCSWDGRKIVEAAAKIGLVRGAESSLTCRCRIDRIERYLSFFGIAPRVVSGKLSADLSAKGNLWERTWQGTIDVGLAEGAVWGHPYREISCVGRASGDGEHLASQAVLNWDGPEIASISGTLAYGGKADFKAELRADDLERYLGPQVPVRGVRAHARFTGTPAAIDSKADLDWQAVLTDVRAFDVDLKRVEFLGRVRLTGKALVVEKSNISCNGVSILDMAGQLGYRGGEPTALEIDADLGRVLSLPFFAAGDALDGDCRLKVKLTGTCSLDTKKLELSGLASVAFSPTKGGDFWEFRPGPVVLWGQETWRGEPNGVTLRIDLAGTMDRPQVSGNLRLIQDTIEGASQNFTVQNLLLEIAVDENAVGITGEADVGGGKLEWRGKIAHRDYFPEKIDFAVSGARVLIVRTDDLYGRADLDLALAGEVSEKDGIPFCKGRLSGEITVTEFLVSTTMSLQSPPERVFIYPALESNFIDLDLDLKIDIVRAAVRNNLADIETRGEVRVRGKASLPEIGGWVSANYGKLFLPQGVMDITECLVRLKPENFLVPELNVKAETQVRDYRITVTVRGTPSALVIDFSSSPPLPQEDIVSLLITGGTRSELQQSGAEKLQETGSFIVTQQLLNAIGIGNYVSAQVTGESGTVTISPPSWKGIALQARIDKEGKVRVHVMYRFSFK